MNCRSGSSGSPSASSGPRGWLINDALRDYLDREERRAERYRQSLEALEELEGGAPMANGDEVLAWIESWGTEAEKPVPRLTRR